MLERNKKLRILDGEESVVSTGHPIAAGEAMLPLGLGSARDWCIRQSNTASGFAGEPIITFHEADLQGTAH